MSKKVSLVVKETGGSNEHDNFVLPEATAPEGDKLNRAEVANGTKQITTHTKNAIVEEMSRERTIHMMLENIYQRNPEDPVVSIKQFVADCREKSKNVYHELFADSTPTGEIILENDALARELLNHCLGTRGRGKGFTQAQRAELKELLFELNSDSDETDILTNLMSLMPQSLHGANKMDLMSKVSILLLLLANSHPEKFAKMDEFFEKQVLIDAMVSGKNFSEAIEEILSYAGAFEAKNAGQVYNYRVDNLFQFAHAAEHSLAKIPEFLGKNQYTDAFKRRRAKKNDPALRLFQDWYEMVQKHLLDFSKEGTSAEQNYQLYVLLTKLYTLQHLPADKKQSSSLTYLSDLGEGYQEWVEYVDEYVQDYFADRLVYVRTKDVLNHSKYENLSEYFSLEGLEERIHKKRLMSVWTPEEIALAEELDGKLVLKLDHTIDYYNEHGELYGQLTQSDLIELMSILDHRILAKIQYTIYKKSLLEVWSAEAVDLALHSEGKIVLRTDGKIDFYDEHGEMICKGVARLTVEGPTDLSDYKNALVQGGYQGGGVRGLSYMSGKRAMAEAGKQGKKLFSASDAQSKMNALLTTLGTNGAEKSKALQALFGSDFSGCWDLNDKEWTNVGLLSYLGLSEVYTNGIVRTVYFDSVDSNQSWNNDLCPQPFLACEEC